MTTSAGPLVAPGKSLNRYGAEVPPVLQPAIMNYIESSEDMLPILYKQRLMLIFLYSPMLDSPVRVEAKFEFWRWCAAQANP